ncbi:Calx-beta domain-containing protein [Bradyrhizobium sp. AUGA SZCCT0182]|uniref:Calx-beta domain-containing protein n=1 Tax=Bradyrhizobium sp. AUGA SZCCT0182 TaxID=2807667 RepID=UPI001BAAD12E|nr:Calx-beta domain-containing protein [Bradyrhizobium sp. AUGA SZCCT0182]MBR1231965.1 PD40 domain-containing protein [Bradyrhizobium sp. AUGA SZCCT0182]
MPRPSSPNPTFAVASVDAVKPEGNTGTTAFTFTVTRAGPSGGTASVNYTVTGAQPDDFTGGVRPSGTITFARNETSKTITILVAGDSQIETDEAFTVTLSRPTGARIGTASATGTIQNDDSSAVERISVASDGTQGNGSSLDSSISADGRYVTYHSDAPDLVDGDTNGINDVFVFDRETGTTERVSVSSTGEQGNNASFSPNISADGRYVTYFSLASNLVDGDTNGNYDVFVFDRETGTNERISVSSTGEQGNGTSFSPDISADGRYVTYYSDASNLVDGDTNGTNDIFVFERETATTERVSVSSTGEQGDGGSFSSDISADGRYVTYSSTAANLVDGDTNGQADVFIFDRQTGTTEWVSVSSTGEQGNSASFEPSISADGGYVTYQSLASNLVDGDTNETFDVFVFDGQTETTERVSVSSAGEQGNDASIAPSISADGRYVPYFSPASNLVDGDTNETYDDFVFDRQTDTTERVSVSAAGEQGNSDSSNASISADGTFVTYSSSASNLVDGDTNGTYDVFVVQLQELLLA